MYVQLFAIALVMTGVIAQDETFENESDKPINFTCPEGEVIRSVYSTYDDQEADRKWRFSCGKTPGNFKPSDKCSWTDDFVNNWKTPAWFMCRPNFMITGIASVHNSAKADRRLQIQCCRTFGVRTRSCGITDVLNDWGGTMDYNVTKGTVVTGILSVYSTRKADRRHKAIECMLQQTDTNSSTPQE